MATKKKTTEEVIPEEKAVPEEAPKKAAPKKNAEPKVEEPAVDPMEEYIEIELFKDSGKYSDDVFVAVNGENCIIQRGVRTKIKRKFYEVLRSSQEQEQFVAREISNLTTN